MVPARLLRTLRRIGVESTIVDPAQLTHNYICMYTSFIYTCMYVCVCITRRRACASWRTNVSLGIKGASSQSHFVCLFVWLYVCAIRNSRCLLTKITHTHIQTHTCSLIEGFGRRSIVGVEKLPYLQIYPNSAYVCVCVCACVHKYI